MQRTKSEERSSDTVARTITAVVLLVLAVSVLRIRCGAQVNETADATRHRVKLTWNASKPASRALGDAIIGYIVYRSTQPHDRNAKPINLTRVIGTSYVDFQVEPGKIYYYFTRAVSARGELSGPSNEVRAEIPNSNALLVPRASDLSSLASTSK